MPYRASALKGAFRRRPGGELYDFDFSDVLDLVPEETSEDDLSSTQTVYEDAEEGDWHPDEKVRDSSPRQEGQEAEVRMERFGGGKGADSNAGGRFVSQLPGAALKNWRQRHVEREITEICPESTRKDPPVLAPEAGDLQAAAEWEMQELEREAQLNKQQQHQQRLCYSQPLQEPPPLHQEFNFYHRPSKSLEEQAAQQEEELEGYLHRAVNADHHRRAAACAADRALAYHLMVADPNTSSCGSPPLRSTDRGGSSDAMRSSPQLRPPSSTPTPMDPSPTFPRWCHGAKGSSGASSQVDTVVGYAENPAFRYSSSSRSVGRAQDLIPRRSFAGFPSRKSTSDKVAEDATEKSVASTASATVNVTPESGRKTRQRRSRGRGLLDKFLCVTGFRREKVVENGEGQKQPSGNWTQTGSGKWIKLGGFRRRRDGGSSFRKRTATTTAASSGAINGGFHPSAVDREASRVETSDPESQHGVASAVMKGREKQEKVSSRQRRGADDIDINLRDASLRTPQRSKAQKQHKRSSVVHSYTPATTSASWDHMTADFALSPPLVSSSGVMMATTSGNFLYNEEGEKPTGFPIINQPFLTEEDEQESEGRSVDEDGSGMVFSVEIIPMVVDGLRDSGLHSLPAELVREIKQLPVSEEGDEEMNKRKR